MISTAATPDEYFESLPADRQEVINRLYNTIAKNLPHGFDQRMSYGMLTWVVPHSIYPNGYHCDPKQALPFLSLASQKNFIALYHMGIYADKALYDWFVAEYPKHSKTKLDMGKSCIRFKKPENIPFDLLAELFQKMTPADWVMQYEKMLNAPRETK